MNSSVQLICNNLHLKGVQHSGGSRGGTRGSGHPSPLLIFRLKGGLKGSKNFFGRPPPPLPPLSQDLDPALQHETNNKTLHHEHSKSFPTYTSQINPVGFFPRKLLNTLNVPVLWIFQHVFFETRTGDLSY